MLPDNDPERSLEGMMHMQIMALSSVLLSNDPLCKLWLFHHSTIAFTVYLSVSFPYPLQLCN